MSEWIKCSERLPEPLETVLIFAPGCLVWSRPEAPLNYFIGRMQPRLNGAMGWKTNDDPDPDTACITHWMPLPPEPEAL